MAHLISVSIEIRSSIAKADQQMFTLTSSDPDLTIEKVGQLLFQHPFFASQKEAILIEAPDLSQKRIEKSSYTLTFEVKNRYYFWPRIDASKLTCQKRSTISVGESSLVYEGGILARTQEKKTQ